MRTMTRLSVVALIGAGTVIPMTSASAADAVTRSGACSATSSWTLRAAEAAGDRSNLRLTIDSPRAGQTWSIQEARQGVQFFSGRRTTDAQGDIVLTTSPREVNGVTDVYTAQARNLSTGETCTARVALPG